MPNRFRNLHVASGEGDPRRNYEASKVHKKLMTDSNASRVAPRGKIANPGYIGTDGFGRTQSSRDAKSDSKKREKEIHGPAMVKAAEHFADVAGIKLPLTFGGVGHCGIQFKKDLADLFEELTVREKAHIHLFAKQKTEIHKLRMKAGLDNEGDEADLVDVDGLPLDIADVGSFKNMLNEGAHAQMCNTEATDAVPFLLHLRDKDDGVEVQPGSALLEQLNADETLALFDSAMPSRASSPRSLTSVTRITTDTESD